jgi:hypothetical protein
MDNYPAIDTAFTPVPTNVFRGPVATRKSQLGFHIDEKVNFVRDEDSITQLKPKEEDMEPLTIQAKSCCNTYQAREELLKQLRDTINAVQKAIGQLEKYNRAIRDGCREDTPVQMREIYDKASNEYFKAVDEMMNSQIRRHHDTIQASEETISKILVNQSDLRRVIALAMKEVFPENPRSD